ncbi:MAG TPA: hypothetical protein VFU31_24825 [Candidatus Binatia bacterium]|nr:hypothetical protein [Candidatus Binatia bacterium]
MTDAEMEAKAAQKLHAALPAKQPDGIRKREFLYALVFIGLAWMYLDRDSYTDQLIIEERRAQIAKCRAIQDQHARNLTTLLDRGGILYVNGDPVTLCRRKS